MGAEAAEVPMARGARGHRGARRSDPSDPSTRDGDTVGSGSHGADAEGGLNTTGEEDFALVSPSETLVRFRVEQLLFHPPPLGRHHGRSSWVVEGVP